MSGGYDHIVLGAGIMGLETARLLSGYGNRVLIVDRGLPARGASWAAAGILVRRGQREPLDEEEVYYQSIEMYPDWIGELRKLKDVDLSYNELTELPESFGLLKNLAELDLSNNPLTSLPGSCGNLNDSI